MEIINNYEVYESNECYFVLGEDEDLEAKVCVFITPISYWENNLCLDDQFADHSLRENILPEGIFNLMEGTWESEFDIDQTRELMLKAGFVESKDMTDRLFERD